MLNRYSVYWKKTGEPLIIGGTAKECARAMDIDYPSFWATYTRIKTGHPLMSQKWHIVQEKEGSEDGKAD